MTKATVSDCVKTLEQKQLISRVYEKHDTRSYVIHLSAKGRAVAKKTSFFGSQIQIPVNRLADPDKENLLTSLLYTIHHLNQTGVISIQRMCLTCQYYNSDNGHFCQLLNQRLAAEELQTDCPEHVFRQAA